MSEPAANRTPQSFSRRTILYLLTLFIVWAAVYATALRTPPLLDDADATHAQAVQAIVDTGDWVTLHVDGIRYLEKAPLPYWLSAISLRVFGANAFAIHLPLALSVLALALLGFLWAHRAFGERAALYTALFTLTSTGVFLFTRIFIPEVLLAVFFSAALYSALCALETAKPIYAYAFWLLMALAVLTKGLIAIVFLLGTLFFYTLVTKRPLARLRPASGILLFLLVAAPWHILAGLRNTHGANGHGFFWFYFVNEHFLRFLGERLPRDYNKLPAALYWTQHLAWLFPWSVFLPAAAWIGWRQRLALLNAQDLDNSGDRVSRLRLRAHLQQVEPVYAKTLATRTVTLLGIFIALVIVFFSFSTNQEYYTFPVYMPLLMLLAASITIYEDAARTTLTARRLITLGHALLCVIGIGIAAALFTGLYRSRHLPAPSDIGELLAHRNIGGYTLSTSHFFDLTATSLAALRLPALLAAVAFLLGPGIAWALRQRRKHMASTLTIAFTAATFLIAAHIALVRFAPVLSSESFAAHIQQLDPQAQSRVLLYGDQAFGSSIPFYLHRPVELVDGRTTSMQFGSTFPDVPPLFLTHQQLAATWGTGTRQFLFVPPDHREEVEHLLAGRFFSVAETSGKLLLTDRPLSAPEGIPHP